jgi:hypothetical protein
MARSALNELEIQLEAIRREAYAAGYAAAMQAVRDLASKPAPTMSSSSTRGRRSQPARGRGRAAQPTRRAQTARPVRRQQRQTTRQARGAAALLIEEVLRSNAPHALRPDEIRAAIQRDKGIAMAFTSIRNAIGQLEARQTVEQVGDSRTWRYRGGDTIGAA